MALFQLDPKQLERLETQIGSLNTAMIQQTTAIQSGFASLIAALTGADVTEVQKHIDEHALKISAVRETLQSSIDRNQPKGE